MQPFHCPHSPCSYNISQNKLKVYSIANSQWFYYKVAIQRNLQAAAAEKVVPEAAVKTAEANNDTNAEKEAGKAAWYLTIPDQVVDAKALPPDHQPSHCDDQNFWSVGAQLSKRTVFQKKEEETWTKLFSL